MTEPLTSTPRPRDELAATLQRVEIQRAASSVPGRDIVQVLTTIPAGAESGWHLHPGEEIGFLLAGTIELLVRGRPAVTVRAGEGFLVPPRTPHNARDIGADDGKMLSTYLVEAGEPLATLTE